MNRRRFAIGFTGAVCSLSGCLGVFGDDADGDEGEDSGDDGDAANGGSTENEDGDNGDEEASGESESSPDMDDTDSDDVEALDDIDEGDPESVVESFYAALYEPDVETANGLLHSDSPQPLYSQSSVDRFSDFEHEIPRIETADEPGDTAVVDLTLVIIDSDGGERENDLEIELRQESGSWQIWEAN